MNGLPPFFLSERLTRLQLAVIIGYGVLTAVICLIVANPYVRGVVEQHDPSWGTVKLYGAFSQGLLFPFAYHALRNIRFFGYWLLFGTVHWLLYTFYYEEPSFWQPRGSDLDYLQNTLLILVIFQASRFLHRKLYNSELAIAAQGSTTIQDDSKPTGLGLLISALLFLLPFLLVIGKML